jgi:hypothetical protein
LDKILYEVNNNIPQTVVSFTILLVNRYNKAPCIAEAILPYPSRINEFLDLMLELILLKSDQYLVIYNFSTVQYQSQPQKD